MLAHALLASHDVVMVERGADALDPRFPVLDTGLSAGPDPHFGGGLGGSTQLWHNGLIEIDDEIFDAHWPFAKAELAPYYDQAFPLLAGTSLTQVARGIADLRQRYRSLGLPEGLLQGLYYPRWPRNLWTSLDLAGRVTLVAGDVLDFELDGSGQIAAMQVQVGEERQTVRGDVFVLAAGGLGSPVLLQRLAQRAPLPGLVHAGAHYEDHPMGFVGEVEVTVPLYRLWNFHVPGTDGNLRLPLVVKRDGLHVSFQLRPAATYHRASRRERVGSVLNLLRRNPWNPLNYVQLFKHWDDVLDILSFKFGIRLPTRHYTLLMCAQMPTSPELSVWLRPAEGEAPAVRVRHWVLTDAFRRVLDASVEDVLAWLKPVTRRARVFADWQSGLRSAAHHSGTARMSVGPEAGVCNPECRVHGLDNLYVCDGSVIPSSGIANTGLTIAALALRLAAHLRQRH
ncbi:GMC family oxidoreductase [Roseateles sp. BYS87W]|uniref:GMC family oxidoreductase n=1 Tax=Pelomonas baiyunensis TaxID=3299026 RepID=A0ABW7GWY3_9BURK